MKTIGLIGGITWHSTLDYYRLLNTGIEERLGGIHSAKIILNSVDFSVVKELTFNDDWDGLASMMTDAAQALEKAGASCLMIGANTMHHIADQVQANINIPLIHIADATAGFIEKQEIKKVALLGTRYTMQLPFFREKLLLHGISTIIPDDPSIEFVNHAIYEEFAKGNFHDATKDRYMEIIDGLAQQGARGVVLGCTEIPILLKDIVSEMPFFDTANCHVQAALNYALS